MDHPYKKLILIFLIIMSVITWGALAKALNDNETIEEAVTRFIQAHEDDADAHIESGESLYAHKHSGIIDHLAGSIVTDKLDPLDFLINQAWPDKSAMNSQGEVVTLFPRVELISDWTIPQTSYISFPLTENDIGNILLLDFIVTAPIK